MLIISKKNTTGLVFRGITYQNTKALNCNFRLVILKYNPFLSSYNGPLPFSGLTIHLVLFATMATTEL